MKAVELVRKVLLQVARILEPFLQTTVSVLAAPRVERTTPPWLCKVVVPAMVEPMTTLVVLLAVALVPMLMVWVAAPPTAEPIEMVLVPVPWPRVIWLVWLAPPIVMTLLAAVPRLMVPEAAAWIEIAPAPLPPWIVVVWAAAPLLPMVMPTVPVVVPPLPIATVLVVEAPGVPVAMLTTLPPAVVLVPAPMLTVWVEEVPLAELMLTVEVVAVVAWPMVMVPVPVAVPRV
jgi:signal-induced proliferation-associated 1 like protein 3